MSPSPPSTAASCAPAQTSSPPTGTAPPLPTATPSIPSLSPDPLRRLLDETADLIDSPSATRILTLFLDTLFSHLTDHVLRSQAFKFPPTSSTLLSEPRISELSSDAGAEGIESWEAVGAKAKLATILAVITRQAHAIGNGVPNEYVQAMEGVREMEAFAAVVYCSHFEVELGAVNGSEALGRGEGGESGDRAVEVDMRPEEVVPEDAAEKVVAGGKGIIGATWSVMEGVWGRVFGGGGGAITG
jgi:peroxin-3